MLQKLRRRSILKKGAHKAAHKAPLPTSFLAWTTDDVVAFAAANVTGFSLSHCEVLVKQCIIGEDLSSITPADLERWGLPGGPAKRLWKAIIRLVCPDVAKAVDNALPSLIGEVAHTRTAQPEVLLMQAQEALAAVTEKVAQTLLKSVSPKSASSSSSSSSSSSAFTGKLKRPGSVVSDCSTSVEGSSPRSAEAEVLSKTAELVKAHPEPDLLDFGSSMAATNNQSSSSSSTTASTTAGLSSPRDDVFGVHTAPAHEQVANTSLMHDLSPCSGDGEQDTLLGTAPQPSTRTIRSSTPGSLKYASPGGAAKTDHNAAVDQEEDDDLFTSGLPFELRN